MSTLAAEVVDTLSLVLDGNRDGLTLGRSSQMVVTVRWLTDDEQPIEEEKELNKFVKAVDNVRDALGPVAETSVVEIDSTEN